MQQTMQQPETETNPIPVYTAAKAIARLKCSESTFHAWVRSGVLSGINIPGQKSKVYIKAQVDQLAKDREEFQFRYVIVE